LIWSNGTYRETHNGISLNAVVNAANPNSYNNREIATSELERYRLKLRTSPAAFEVVQNLWLSRWAEALGRSGSHHPILSMTAEEARSRYGPEGVKYVIGAFFTFAPKLLDRVRAWDTRLVDELNEKYTGLSEADKRLGFAALFLREAALYGIEDILQPQQVARLHAWLGQRVNVRWHPVVKDGVYQTGISLHSAVVGSQRFAFLVDQREQFSPMEFSVEDFRTSVDHRDKDPESLYIEDYTNPIRRVISPSWLLHRSGVHVLRLHNPATTSPKQSLKASA
jgi:hypothetical protein